MKQFFWAFAEDTSAIGPLRLSKHPGIYLPPTLHLALHSLTENTNLSHLCSQLNWVNKLLTTLLPTPLFLVSKMRVASKRLVLIYLSKWPYDLNGVTSTAAVPAPISPASAILPPFGLTPHPWALSLENSTAKEWAHMFLTEAHLFLSKNLGSIGWRKARLPAATHWPGTQPTTVWKQFPMTTPKSQQLKIGNGLYSKPNDSC
jgi:hypothetical protein